MNVLPGASAVPCRDSRSCTWRVKDGGKGVEEVRITGSQNSPGWEGPGKIIWSNVSWEREPS